MARNEEKALSGLNRFVAWKAEEKKKPREFLPYLASECRDLNEAYKLHQQIEDDIDRKLTEIQNASLGEHRVRDLNDEINKRMREGSHWKRRIVVLGSQNYTNNSAKMTDLECNIVDVPNPSGRGPGYCYFGAAKKLPGVRELFEKPPELRKRRARYDIYKRIDASYYGYRDGYRDDERVEGPAEKKMRVEAVAEWRRMEDIWKETRTAVKSGGQVVTMAKEALERELKEREFVAYVPLPDDREIERMVLEKKKMDLVSKYASQVLLEEQSEAKEMLNIQS